MEEIGLYLHLPFCVKKCAYCDFLSFPAGEETKQLYAQALIREIRAYSHPAKGRCVKSIFLGGGTPSVMSPRDLRQIFEALRDSYYIAPDAEITMEMNPGTVNASNLAVVSSYVNRVSLGVQSANEAELKALGRIHTFREAVRSVELLRDGGISNINLDLMLGIPCQSAASLRETLSAVLALSPEHISAYSLILEEGTEFARLAERGELPLPDEETERELFNLAREVLAASGYRQYEFSNFAREGRQCRHNIRYWKRGEYLGFGIGAASLFEGRRWRNTRDADLYLKDSADPRFLVREMEQLSLRSEIEEHMFLGLRMTEGITAEEFEERFHVSLLDIYGEILDRQIGEGVMATDGRGRYYLTERGIEVSNVVLADFLMDQ